MDFRKGHACVDLGGQWCFAYADGDIGTGVRSAKEIKERGLTVHPCTVPGNFELDLQANGIISDPFYGMNMVKLREYERYHVWYFRSFRADAPQDCDAELLFEGVDCFADIFLNGNPIGSCDNMLVEHAFNANGLLRDENELVVHIRPAVVEAQKQEYRADMAALGSNYESLYVRKAPHMYGWDIMPRAGGRNSGDRCR